MKKQVGRFKVDVGDNPGAVVRIEYQRNSVVTQFVEFPVIDLPDLEYAVNALKREVGLENGNSKKSV